MNEQTMGKIMSAMCGSRKCYEGNCPFASRYNNGFYLCRGAKPSADRFIDCVARWLACNDIDCNTKHALTLENVYDEFAECCNEVRWV